MQNERWELSLGCWFKYKMDLGQPSNMTRQNMEESWKQDLSLKFHFRNSVAQIFRLHTIRKINSFNTSCDINSSICPDKVNTNCLTNTSWNALFNCHLRLFVFLRGREKLSRKRWTICHGFSFISVGFLLINCACQWYYSISFHSRSSPPTFLMLHQSRSGHRNIAALQPSWQMLLAIYLWLV